MNVHHVCGWCLWRPAEGIRLAGARVAYGYEQPYGCCELNMEPILYTCLHLPSPKGQCLLPHVDCLKSPQHGPTVLSLEVLFL